MARLKTAYREKPAAAEIDAAEPNIPGEYLPDEDSLQREAVAPAESKPHPEAPQPQEQAVPQGDAATAVLRSQIESAKRAEAIHQQRQAAAAAEQRRVEWVKSSPLAIEHYAALGPLHHEALKAGFDDLSEEYFTFLESGLAAIAQSQEQRQEQPAVEPMGHPMPVERPQTMAAVEPPPEFFGPKPVAMPAPRQIPVSAPVSRSVPSVDRDRTENPANVRLSPAQREAAKMSGISEIEYARQLVRMERAKRDGLVQS